MGENMKRSPAQWAPWISDPDPPEEPMTPEQSKTAAKSIKELMADPNRQEPVDPAQPPPKTTEQMREEVINKLFREEVINELLRDHPTLTREKAEEEVDAFL